MVKVIEKEIHDGYDCWGRAEYTNVYVVLDENGHEIFRSRNNPTKLIEYLTVKNKDKYKEQLKNSFNKLPFIKRDTYKISKNNPDLTFIFDENDMIIGFLDD